MSGGCSFGGRRRAIPLSLRGRTLVRMQTYSCVRCPHLASRRQFDIQRVAAGGEAAGGEYGPVSPPARVRSVFDSWAELPGFSPVLAVVHEPGASDLVHGGCHDVKHLLRVLMARRRQLARTGLKAPPVKTASEERRSAGHSVQASHMHLSRHCASPPLGMHGSDATHSRAGNDGCMIPGREEIV